MQALVMNAPSPDGSNTAVEDVPAPALGPGEVSIDVAYAGVNFADVMMRRGDPGYAPSWPLIAGKEIAGTVRELARGVTGLAVGQRVAAFLPAAGGFAQVASVPASCVVAVPAAVDLSLAAAAPLMLSTALLLIRDVSHFKAGETVLVHSASGGVGAAVAQIVRLLGGGVLVGTVGRAEKLSAAHDAGYDTALTRDQNLPGALDSRLQGGVDVVLDPLGTTMLDVDLALAAPGARIVLFGNADGGELQPLPALPRLMQGNLTLSGFSVSRLWSTVPQRVAGTLADVLALLERRELTPILSEVGSLAEVPGVQDLLSEGRGTGKYVVRI